MTDRLPITPPPRPFAPPRCRPRGPEAGPRRPPSPPGSPPGPGPTTGPARGAGSFVPNVMNRQPALVARMASTRQVASGGRAILGIGTAGRRGARRLWIDSSRRSARAGRGGGRGHPRAVDRGLGDPPVTGLPTPARGVGASGPGSRPAHHHRRTDDAGARLAAGSATAGPRRRHLPRETSRTTSRRLAAAGSQGRTNLLVGFEEDWPGTSAPRLALVRRPAPRGTGGVAGADGDRACSDHRRRRCRDRGHRALVARPASDRGHPLDQSRPRRVKSTSGMGAYPGGQGTSATWRRGGSRPAPTTRGGRASPYTGHRHAAQIGRGTRRGEDRCERRPSPSACTAQPDGSRGSPRAPTPSGEGRDIDAGNSRARRPRTAAAPPALSIIGVPRRRTSPSEAAAGRQPWISVNRRAPRRSTSSASSRPVQPERRAYHQGRHRAPCDMSAGWWRRRSRKRRGADGWRRTG